MVSGPPSPSAASPSPLSWLARWWPLIVLAGVLAVGAWQWWWNAFHDRGYAPEQPIAFSHRLHAGELKLDCRYCHFNAERGKHAGIPPMSVCMGCHAVVASDRPQIQRLAEIAQQGSYTAADGTVHEGGVVHWRRVHRLPDHVYFDHRAHVAAGVACQTCHGPVEEMTVLRQFADLTMQWCLDCHRGTRYVGGPGTDPNDPTTWRVGVADYEALRARERRDPIVVFHERRLRGSAAGAHGHGEAPAPDAAAAEEPAAAPDPRLAAFLAAHPAFAAKVRELPAWRAAALPDSHRLMNAATDCSTCHQ
ncbi:MAG: cytochrome c family protein [Planctomycetes bacterium]|nr:cytochrome c family protein [Planctomycetota bacterium]